MKNLTLRERIKEILAQVLMKHHDDISAQDDYAISEAADQILQAVEEILLDKKDIFGTTIDIIRSPIMIVSPKYKKR